MFKNVPSLEFMTLQNDNFYNDLCKAIDFIRKDPDFKTQTLHESKLELIIFKRLGISCEFSIERYPYANAYVLLPPVDSDHVFVKPFTRFHNQQYGELISYFDKRNDRIGIIDTKGVRVGGVFSTIPVPLVLSHGLFNHRFSTPEIVSTILHELGHAYTYFYYLHHTAMGSFVSLSTAALAMGAKSDAEKVTIIEKGLRIMGLDGVAIRDLTSQTKDQLEQTLQTLYINKTVSYLRSETGFGIYELRACEQLADWFASKFSADTALHLTTALVKMRRYHHVIAGDSFGSGKYAVTAAAATVQFVSNKLQSGTNLITNVLLYDDNIRIYDKPSERARLLRQSIIDSVKDESLPPVVRDRLVKSADAISSVIKESEKYDNTPGWLSKFIRTKLVAGYRNNLSATKLQKNIEELMYNEAYIHAAKLRGLSK